MSAAGKVRPKTVTTFFCVVSVSAFITAGQTASRSFFGLIMIGALNLREAPEYLYITYIYISIICCHWYALLESGW